MPFVKPRGGLWTSTYHSRGKFASDWVEWCYYEMPEWIYPNAFLLDIKEDARIYIIDTFEDLEQLLNLYPSNLVDKIGNILSSMFALIDWESVSEDYDGVNLTRNGQIRTRFSRPSLYGWDSESTLWFRNVFSKIRKYKGKLVRYEKQQK